MSSNGVGLEAELRQRIAECRCMLIELSDPGKAESILNYKAELEARYRILRRGDPLPR